MSLPARYLRAYVEGVLFDDNPQPVFAKIATQGHRTFDLHPGPLCFLEDYAEYDIQEHQAEYELHERFPIEYYVMHVSDGRSIRFSTEGEKIGELGDEPLDAHFEFSGKRYAVVK